MCNVHASIQIWRLMCMVWKKLCASSRCFFEENIIFDDQSWMKGLFLKQIKQKSSSSLLQIQVRVDLGWAHDNLIENVGVHALMHMRLFVEVLLLRWEVLWFQQISEAISLFQFLQNLEIKKIPRSKIQTGVS